MIAASAIDREGHDARRDQRDLAPARPLIETDRLILRPPIEADIEPWGAMLADPEAMRFIGGPQRRSRRWMHLVMITLWKPDGSSLFSVVEKSTNRWIGRIGPREATGWPGTEIAWSLAPQAWGHGYAGEGAAAAMDWVIASLGWSDIVHVIRPDNLASIAVATRLGSSDRGPRALPPPKQATIVNIWGQTAEQWLASTATAVAPRPD